MKIRFQPSGVAAAVSLVVAMASQSVWAQAAATPAASGASAPENSDALPEVTVRAASADASAQGLSPAYPGGQVARGGRAGILGTKDNLDTPFSITSYTNQLIQDRQARSVGDVLQNDPTVRVARGFGNFQESYFIRGFLLSSDEVAYNGLYSLLPRQYIATELFERVEVLRGASAFLTGANPSGSGIGGSINLLPKRAPNDPLNRFTFSVDGNGSLFTASADLARRFGPDQSTGVRVNIAGREGGTGIDDEHIKLGLASVGLDWHNRDVRLSGDIGVQDNKLRESRTNVALGNFFYAPVLSSVPSAPDANSNWSQPWSYSNERDVFGTFRGEFDLANDLTAWVAYGVRRGKEANSLGNLEVINGSNGDAVVRRFDNTRKDNIGTGEIGLRGKLRTGSVGHEWVASWSIFDFDKKAAYAVSGYQNTNLYNPVNLPLPALTFFGNTLSAPELQSQLLMRSVALGDTLSMLEDRLLLTLGARHQEIRSVSYNFAPTGFGSSPFYNEDRTSPVIGAVYKLDPHASVYANYIEGLSQGSTAPLTGVSNPGASLAPYVARQKEVGLKYDGGRFGGSVALFSTTKPRNATTVNGVFQNDGEDEHRGVEFSVQGTPVRGVKVLGGLTWLDTEQKNTALATVEGKRVIGVPRLQASIGSEWQVPGMNGLALDGRLVYTGASYADDNNVLKVSSWTRIDVGVRYLADVQSHLVTFRARIENLANRDYWSSVGGYPGNGYLVLGAPRTLGVSASVDF